MINGEGDERADASGLKSTAARVGPRDFARRADGRPRPARTDGALPREPLRPLGPPRAAPWRGGGMGSVIG